MRTFDRATWRSAVFGIALAALVAGCGAAADDTEPMGAAGPAGPAAGVGGSGGTAGSGGTTGSSVGAAGTNAVGVGTSGGAAGNSGTAGSGGAAGSAGVAGSSGADAAIDAQGGGSDAGDGGARDSNPPGADATAIPDAPRDAITDGPSSARHTPRPLGTTAAALGYYEYLPPGYGDGAMRPILFFFHGVGENGNGAEELSRVLAHGPPKLVAMNQWPASRPFIVLSPQHRPLIGPPDPIYGGFDCWTPGDVHDFVAFALAHYDIDPRRIYVTGLSCGAMGSANYFRQYGTQQGVAAAVLVSGNANIFWPQQGCPLVQAMGLWALHGDADTAVPIAGDDTAMALAMGCPMPRKDVKYTVYPGVGHDAWTRTYDLSAGNDVYAWLLGFSR